MAVRAGQVLARLDYAPPRAALNLAQAQVEAARRAVRESEVRLAEARLTLRRRLQLVEDRVTRAEVDQAQAEVDSVEARIQAAGQQVAVAERQSGVQQTELDNTMIRARSAARGTAQGRPARRDGVAGLGRRRLHPHRDVTIVDMRSLEIEVDVNESLHQPVKRRNSAWSPCSTPIPTGRSRPTSSRPFLDCRSPESHGAGPRLLRRARSADLARHGRQGALPPRRGGSAHGRQRTGLGR